MYQLFWDNETVVANKSSAGGLDALLAVRGQWYVRGAGVSSGKRPFGLTVADNEATGSRH